MSLHPSLRRLGGKAGRLRNVLKRFERVRDLMARREWNDGRSVFALPKTKIQRLKARKGPAKEAATDEAAAKTGTPPAKEPA